MKTNVKNQSNSNTKRRDNIEKHFSATCRYDDGCQNILAEIIDCKTMASARVEIGCIMNFFFQVYLLD